MPIPSEDAFSLLTSLGDADLAGFAAEVEARHVLLETGEVPENFPPFAEALDEKGTGLAYAYLAVGCSLMEHGKGAEGAAALERAARLLDYVYGTRVVASKEAGFHVLLAAMAAYASGQYSWAFVMMRTVEPVTDATMLVSAFLRQDREAFQAVIGRILLAEASSIDDGDHTEEAITQAIARTLAFAMEFFYTGEGGNLERARSELDDAATIALEGMAPAWWWITRLLALMLIDLESASLWTVLPPYFGGEAARLGTLGRYVRRLAFDRVRPVQELWRSQREALPQALGSNLGAVISLRTGAGKTRVAELAMLQAFTMAPDAKVLFLAPFRSLAFEMEHTLSRTFRPLGYSVSHLYGGARANQSDAELASDAHIIVATPEKARALFRAAPDLFSAIQLIVIDEGHLIGSDFRGVRNEMYYEHLRVRARKTGARLLLLSAALPNAADIARWIASDAKHLGQSKWRPSLQRFGLLRWNGEGVKLDWNDGREPANPFIVARRTSERANARKFPGNRNEAIAATAVRLWADERPVMIFCAQARSVQGMAKSVVKALTSEGKSAVHRWPEKEWRVFEGTCEEELPDGAIELAAARLGVVCHSNSLPSQVRIALEHLMRSGAPRIIIATKTLAQGVNLGVTAVIVASTLVTKGEFVDQRDFLNIAGRAGRAFVDIEGKILFVIDETDPAKARRAEAQSVKYFGALPPNEVVSGVLLIIRILKSLATRVGVGFERLLDMAAEDNFTTLGDENQRASGFCDLLDDALLSIHEDGLVNVGGEEPAIWVERLFRESLGALQAEAGQAQQRVTGDQVVRFLQARAVSTLRRAPTPEQRKAVVSSGLPLRVALRMFDDIAVWTKMVDAYQAASESLEAQVRLLTEVEGWTRQKASELADKAFPEDAILSRVRAGWLGGTPLRILCGTEKKLHDACREFYGFTLTWIIHAASQQLRAGGGETRADLLARLSLCVELGLPSEFACRIYLAGVRSRATAVEIAQCGIPLGDSVSAIARSLREDTTLSALRTLLSPKANAWLDLVALAAASPATSTPNFPPFSLPDLVTNEALFVRAGEGTTYLSSVDGRISRTVAVSQDFPFDLVANDPRYCFTFDGGAWLMRRRDLRS